EGWLRAFEKEGLRTCLIADPVLRTHPSLNDALPRLQNYEQNLRSLSSDDDIEVRRAVAEVIGRLEDPSVESIRTLLSLTADEELVRSAAAEVIGRLEDPSDEVLHALLSLAVDENIVVRSAAAEVIGRLEDPSADRALL